MTPDQRAALRKLHGKKAAQFHGGQRARIRFEKRLAKQKTQPTQANSGRG